MSFFSKKSFFITISLFIFFANIFAIIAFYLKEHKFSKNFLIKEIYISDTKFTDRHLLKQLVQTAQYEYINSDNINILQNEISKLPFIKSVKILKKYPDTLFVKIIEKNIRFVTNDGCFLDEDLDIINTVCSKENLIGNTILNGFVDKNKVLNLFEKLDQIPIINNNIIGAYLISGRRWDIVVNINGRKILFKLPESNILTPLSKFFDIIYKSNFFSYKISAIDLRSDKIVILK